jgi:hypothetical protein
MQEYPSLAVRARNGRFADHPGIEKLLICCFLILLREANEEAATPRRLGGIWP